MSLYTRVVRPLAFRLDPETAHRLAMRACAGAGRVRLSRWVVARLFGAPADPRLHTHLAGIELSNPVGLGAGYDKNAEGVNVLSRLGFGFLEIGSVSRWPSAGNVARPRAYRLPADEALIINYGVPNDGAAVVATRLAGASRAVPVGVNVVETNGRPADATIDAIDEVASAVADVAPVADFVVISAECANAPGIHPLARLENLRRLLDAIASPALPPVLLKIRVPAEDIGGVVRVADDYPFVRGFRVNTIAPRPYAGLATPRARWEAMTGALSSPQHGFPAMLQAVEDWYRRCDPAKYALIASGGIRTGRDAYAAIRRGATCVQIVTALVYRGPSLARQIVRELAAALAADGFASVGDAIGVDAGRPV